MASKIFNAGIRFNDPQFKYMSLVFDEDKNLCTVDAHVKLPQTGDMILRGQIVANQWIPVENPTRQAVSPSKTTTKKTVKETK